MTEIAATETPAPRKSSKIPLLIGIVLAIAGAGGGFFAVTGGLMGGDATQSHATIPVQDMPDVTFLEVPPILVTLSPGSHVRQLRFRSQVEAVTAHAAEVRTLMPRIVDVMNSYLRALEPADFEDPQVLPRLRSQLVRRIQIVTGQGRVTDLLVMEFVLN